MGLLHRHSLCRSAAPQLLYYGKFNVADEELRHTTESAIIDSNRQGPRGGIHLNHRRNVWSRAIKAKPSLFAGARRDRRRSSHNLLMHASLFFSCNLGLSVVASVALLLVPQLASAQTTLTSDRTAIASASPNAANASWGEIKNIAFGARAEFEAGLDRLADRIDLQIQELEAKRATMKSDPTAWDFAMKEMHDARAFFRSLVTDVRKAKTESTWNDLKEKAGLAWERSQDAFDKVKASTTS